MAKDKYTLVSADGKHEVGTSSKSLYHRLRAEGYSEKRRPVARKPEPKAAAPVEPSKPVSDGKES